MTLTVTVATIVTMRGILQMSDKTMYTREECCRLLIFPKIPKKKKNCFSCYRLACRYCHCHLEFVFSLPQHNTNLFTAFRSLHTMNSTPVRSLSLIRQATQKLEVLTGPWRLGPVMRLAEKDGEIIARFPPLMLPGCVAASTRSI